MLCSGELKSIYSKHQENTYSRHKFSFNVIYRTTIIFLQFQINFFFYLHSLDTVCFNNYYGQSSIHSDSASPIRKLNTNDLVLSKTPKKRT